MSLLIPMRSMALCRMLDETKTEWTEMAPGHSLGLSLEEIDRIERSAENIPRSGLSINAVNFKIAYVEKPFLDHVVFF